MTAGRTAPLTPQYLRDVEARLNKATGAVGVVLWKDATTQVVLALFVPHQVTSNYQERRRQTRIS